MVRYRQIEGEEKMRALSSFNRERWWIIGIWLMSLITSVVLIFYVDMVYYGSIQSPPDTWRDPIHKLYKDVLAMYVPPLTTMLAIGFATTSTSTPRTRSSGPFCWAIVLSCFWNVTMLAQILRLVFVTGLEIQQLIEILPVFPGTLTFLTTPFLAFYFASSKP